MYIIYEHDKTRGLTVEPISKVESPSSPWSEYDSRPAT